ncbi:hypothetical protein L0152_04010, partial [bacterium]|nr:hypothetical protein [bacterium]
YKPRRFLLGAFRLQFRNQSSDNRRLVQLGESVMVDDLYKGIVDELFFLRQNFKTYYFAITMNL